MSFMDPDLQQMLSAQARARAGLHHGYGPCPRCSDTASQATARERRPDGDTTCGACGATTPSRAWGKAPVAAAAPEPSLSAFEEMFVREAADRYRECPNHIKSALAARLIADTKVHLR